VKKRILGLVVAGAVIAAAAAWAQTAQPPISTITPNTEKQVTNIDVLRQQLKNYYGAPLATTGPSGTWTAPLNTDSNYADEARSVAKKGGDWLDARSKRKDKAIVLDVDDTSLVTWNYELYSNWDFNPTTNGQFVTSQLFPAVPGMVDMVTKAASEGYAIFFLTGRGAAQETPTLGNLTSDGIGVDARYPSPTPASPTEDGLFTKPPVGSYPDYLNKPEFCADAIAANASCPTTRYKSGVRAHIESLGWDIVANFGDQFSDLNGGFASRTFKMPNPNYFIP